MRQIHTALFAALVVAGLGACQQQEPAPAPQPGATADAPAVPAEAGSNVTAAGNTATAELAPTEGSQVRGNITFTVVNGRVHANGEITGLAPDSEHGFHIHENGDCSAPDGSSAGGHFNPAGLAHGSIDAGPHHGGDMPNLKADAQGVAKVDTPIATDVNIGGDAAFDIVGKGLIVHADPDDYATQPTGNAGARLACAVIAAGEVASR